MQKLKGNFFTLDLAEAKRVFESVPWVRQAVVSRVWPNRLTVLAARTSRRRALGR